MLLSASDAVSQIMDGNCHIDAPNEKIYRAVLHRWDMVAKPLDSLGKFELLFARIGAIQANEDPTLEPCELLVFCADNGIVEEGISQSDQSVTAQCAESIGQGKSCTGIMAAQAGVRIRSIDIGIAHPKSVDENLPGNDSADETADVQTGDSNTSDSNTFLSETHDAARAISAGEKEIVLHDMKEFPSGLCDTVSTLPGTENMNVRPGTRNFLKEPAMTQAEVRQALLTGIELVRDANRRGVGLLAAGEMGIGNTTTSACMAAALLHLCGEETAGRGAGLDDQRLRRKIQVINKALEKYHFGNTESLKPESPKKQASNEIKLKKQEVSSNTRLKKQEVSSETKFKTQEVSSKTNLKMAEVSNEAKKEQEASNETELKRQDSALEMASKRREALRILQCVGGLDIAAMTGVYLGGAVYHVPIVLDGVISLVAALTAERILPGTKQFLIPSHVSREPAAHRILQELNFHPVLDADMALGEGSGAVMMIDLLKMVERVYRESNDFPKIGVEAYERFSS